MFQKTLNLLLFSSIYIACCAVIMAFSVNELFHLQYDKTSYYYFVFFSTLCSYNFHWYLTPQIETEQLRVKWTQEHKLLHALFFLAGAMGSVWFYFQLPEHWLWLSGSAILTFLYSAPKLSFPPFIYLRKIAIGKTIFLAFVWMYVTSLLPLVLGGRAFSMKGFIFCVNQLFFIYSICILFDYRDRINDKKEGIKSMITYFSEKGINRLFYLCMCVFFVSIFALKQYGFSNFTLFSLLAPGAILLWLYPIAKKNFSDYIYYLVLDGLMMLAALIQLINYF